MGRYLRAISVVELVRHSGDLAADNYFETLVADNTRLKNDEIVASINFAKEYELIKKSERHEGYRTTAKGDDYIEKLFWIPTGVLNLWLTNNKSIFWILFAITNIFVTIFVSKIT